MRKETSGATLPELLVALVILGAVTVMSIPSFNQGLVRHRQHNLARALHGAMLNARSLAISHNMRVIACPSRDSRTCSGQTDWENGWILFADVNDERSLDAENIVPLHVETGPFPGITAYGNQPLSRSFSYMGTGLSERLSGARLMGTIFVCAPGQNSIEVVMAGSGRPKIERKQAPC